MVALRRTASSAAAYGIECELLTAAQAHDHYPLMRHEDLQGALWLPGDGRANPTDLTQALAKAVRRKAFLAVPAPIMKLAADGILGFSTFPLRLISRLGLLISFVSVLGAAFVVYIRISDPSRAVPGWAFIAVGMFLLGGLQLLMMGVIGSYLGRVYIETQDRPLYSLAVMARGTRTDKTETP